MKWDNRRGIVELIEEIGMKTHLQRKLVENRFHWAGCGQRMSYESAGW